MAINENKVKKAAAIIRIFETGRPFGGYDAVAVLNDGAGISYGIAQFTHRSGSLYEVVDLYLKSGGMTGRLILKGNLPKLMSRSADAIKELSQNDDLISALRAAAETREMIAAQDRVFREKYMSSALAACEGSSFDLPLSLAVVYDSMVHGSYAMIRDRIPAANRSYPGYEERWIAAYVRERHRWLISIPRLRKTAYRTAFFLEQIRNNNWELDLPVIVNGFKLEDRHIEPAVEQAAVNKDISAVGPSEKSATSFKHMPFASNKIRLSAVTEPTITQPPDAGRKPDLYSKLDELEAKVNEAAAVYDRVEAVLLTVLRRTDSAKSLWTMVAGTFWQSAWAVSSFALGLPKEVWFGAALLAGVLMAVYLYRQFALGRIREMQRSQLLMLGQNGRQSNKGE